MSHDVRQTAEYAAVTDHLRRQYEPGFGRPHALAEPDVTADGERVVVTGSVFDELAGTPRTELLTVEGGEWRAVTGAAGSARSGRFSPDGRTLAFRSDRARSGVFQLYLLARGTLGEAVPAPTVPGTIEYIHWSPDGRRLLLGVAALGADMAGTLGSGVNVDMPDDLPDWHPIVEDGIADSAWRSLWIYTCDSGELTRLSSEGMNCWEAGWCGPDAVVAVTGDSPEEDAWYHAELTRFDLTTGTGKELLTSDVQLGLPTGSPDGRYVGVVQAICSDRCIVAGDLTVIDLATGRRTVIDTAGADVTHLQWIEPTRLGYLGQRRLTSVIGAVDVVTGSATETFATEESCGSFRYPEGAFTADGRVVVVQSAYHLPPRLSAIDGDKCHVLASTAHPGSDYMRSIAGTAEVVSWPAPDGRTIEGILCAPPGTGPFPLIVCIHGGPISSFRNVWEMRYPYVPLLVAHGYAVLLPNPRGSGGYGQDFAHLVVGDMGGADSHDILSGIDALIDRGIADPARLGLIGASYGGFMTSWLVTQDQRFAAAVPIAPVTDWYSASFTSNIGAWGNAFLASDPEQPDTLVHRRSPCCTPARPPHPASSSRARATAAPLRGRRASSTGHCAPTESNPSSPFIRMRATASAPTSRSPTSSRVSSCGFNDTCPLIVGGLRHGRRGRGNRTRIGRLGHRPRTEPAGRVGHGLRGLRAGARTGELARACPDIPRGIPRSFLRRVGGPGRTAVGGIAGRSRRDPADQSRRAGPRPRP
jgi:dipeptidyl aminopeptidase/acylaminoacyl peptidase